MGAPRFLNRIVLALTLLGISAGLAARFSARPDLAPGLWAATTLIALLPLAWTVLRSLLAGRAGVDLIALVAMAGALLLQQYLAGAVVALMLSGGSALEEYASGRARAELKALLDRSPRVVHLCRDGGTADAPIEAVRPGDRLLVRPGEVVPVDGVVAEGTATLDESAITGEAAPVARSGRDRVLSGTVNAAGIPFQLLSTAAASQSTYAGIVRLVREAQAARAPLVRMADRASIILLPLAAGLAGAAWLLSGDPVRALAVMVVATPCPLILAAPIALVAGISRSARRGIIVKGGGALEALARGRILVLDKTGTVTGGTPVLTAIESFTGVDPDEILRLAASLDQASMHVLAEPILRAARGRGLALALPEEVSEEPGSGIRGRVEGAMVAVGRAEWVAPHGPPDPLRRLRRRALADGSTLVLVARDGEALGALILEDPIRPDAPRALRALRESGFEKIVLLTGDHPGVAESVGAALDVDRVLAERSPAEKVDAVREARGEGVTVMVGDGINDAPALAAADAGVALGARGASASSQAADVVLLVDRLDRLAEAVAIARRSRAIALQSIQIGMGLSLLAMLFAAIGRLPPLPGALLQEAIDVLVILNALRALRGAPPEERSDARSAEVGRQFREEHRRLLPEVKRIRHLADRLDTMSPAEARAGLARADAFLREELLPHNAAEDATAYPQVARMIGGRDPTAPMSRAHREIAHLARVFGSLLEDLPPEGPLPEDRRELRRLLYGLDAILRLHFAQEEESYLALLDDRPEPESTPPPSSVATPPAG